MALSALPSEILSRVCRFIVLDSDPSKWSLPQDLKSLRLSCKSVYQKTLFDTGVIYGRMLDNLIVDVSYKSLGVLFSISNVPYFRDRLHDITFNRPCCRGYCGRRSSCDCANHADNSPWEERTSFANSPEAVYMMTESFKNLAKSTSLLNIYLCEATTYPAVLAALNLASFPRQIIHVLVNPKDYQISSHNHFLNSLAESPHLISHLEFQATLHKDPWDIEPDMRRVDVAHNEFGRHYSGYKSVTPQVSKLAAKLSSVKEVSFRGCDSVPRLRLCHGCEDVWVGIFAKNTYSNLTHLELCGGYVSGSRLRGFLKRHSGTLQHVMFDFVSLTDGNWCSIAKGLQKCLNLNYLDVGPDTTTGRYIGSLRQRHASSPLATSLPKKYVTSGLDASKLQSGDSHIDVVLRNTKDVAHWLDLFVKYFATDKSVSGDCYEAFNGYKLPVYHEARTFLLPYNKVSILDTRSWANIALDKYLKADEGA